MQGILIQKQKIQFFMRKTKFFTKVNTGEKCPYLPIASLGNVYLPTLCMIFRSIGKKRIFVQRLIAQNFVCKSYVLILSSDVA